MVVPTIVHQNQSKLKIPWSSLEDGTFKKKILMRIIADDFGNMPMLSDLQLVYMGPRNSTELLKINTTKFQVEREPVYVLLVTP